MNLSLYLTRWKLKPQSVWCVGLHVSVHSCEGTQCATTACLLANNTFCLFGSHTPGRTGYFKLTHTHTHTDYQPHTYRYTNRPVLSNLIFHLLSDRLMSSDTTGVDMSPWAVTVVTEDPASGQAVTGSSPAASLVSVFTIRPDQDRFVFSYNLMEECAYTPAFCMYVLCVCVQSTVQHWQLFSFTFQRAFVSQIQKSEMWIRRRREYVRESVCSQWL